MIFTDELHQETKKIWRKSIEHSFVQELKAGTLSKDVFRYYLIQDDYYLSHFVRCIAQTLALAPDTETMVVLANSLEGFNHSELRIRQYFHAELGITESELAETLPAPAAYHYTSHLYRQVQSGVFGQALAALLPCYWLYQEIGETFAASAACPEPLYQRWLEIYDSEAYSEAVATQLQLVNQFAATASQQQLADMKQAFIISSYEELNFWEMAYTKQIWE